METTASPPIQTGKQSVCKMQKSPEPPIITNSGSGAEADKQARGETSNAGTTSSGEKENVLPRYYYTQKEFWGGTSLSYTLYTVLALIPLTGFLGLDHMYMRSPGTGFMKFIMNFFTLGFWYFYDVIQAVTEQDDVRTFGVSMPLYGPSGIGAGSFGSEEEPVRNDNGSAGNFLLFCIGSFFLPFGIEYLIAGDIAGFICKLVATLFVIGLIYGLINNMKLITSPDRVLCEGLPRYPPFTWFDVDERFTKTAFRNKLTDNCPPAEGAVSGWFGGIFNNLITKVPGLREIYQTFMGVKDAAKAITKQTGQVLGRVTELGEKAAGLPGQLEALKESAAAAAAAGTATVGSAPVGSATVGSAPAILASAVESATTGSAPAKPVSEISLVGGGQESNSNTILGFTLALVFLGAFFLKGKDAIVALSNKSEERPPAVGNYIVRNKNEFPPLPPEPGVF